MPIYEYSCPKCSSRFELLRSVSQVGEPAACPECQAVAERLISRFACRTASENGGEPVSVAGTGSSCGSCASSSCTSCGG